MSEYISARDALIRDLESAEASLKGAQAAYADAERKLHLAQGVTSSAYDGRAANQRNVDRISKALKILEGEI